MDESTIQPDTAEAAYHDSRGRDGISVLRWFGVFTLLLTIAGAVLVVLLQQKPLIWTGWKDYQASVAAAEPAIKLIIFGMYLSFCCTFLPLNTKWIVSAMAMQSTAVTGELWSTVLVVSIVGALASTLANLNDYHLFTLLLRSRRIAKIRHMRAYKAAENWFARSPFGILLFFNVAPIPVDVSRVLAATHRYPRIPFAAANCIGRFLQYAIIAFVTFQLGKQGWIATVSLLGLAVVMAVGRAILKGLNKTVEKTKQNNDASVNLR
ncbi:MAG: VTT domain-containing protein [Phycisphaerae bacterium]|nr:VTT domain-containing protein [Phycisphaerae bacterium]